jgi:hypothetical protein
MVMPPFWRMDMGTVQIQPSATICSPASVVTVTDVASGPPQYIDAIGVLSRISSADKNH